MQVTVHTPAVGTREYEKTYESGKVLRRVGRMYVTEAMIDSNHVTVLSEDPAWVRQLKLIAAYASFYNPWNIIRALKNDGSRLRRRRFGYQLAGMIATAWTGLKLLPYLLRLMTCKLECYTAAPPMQYVPVRSPANTFPRMPLAQPSATGRPKTASPRSPGRVAA